MEGISMSTQLIIVAKVEKRRAISLALQDVLTKYGCGITMRLGLHEAGDVCSEDGLIILQLIPGYEEREKLLEDFNKIDGVSAKLIEI